MDCTCEVCLLLGDLVPSDVTPELVEQLPRSLRLLLSAMDRVRRHHPYPGDEQLVLKAAAKCIGGKFRPHRRDH